MYKVSIIVPIYNVEKYLEKCITSILNQNYKNIEVILVDDGSIDHSIDICDMFEARDSRVKAYHKANGGLSDARNYGLKRCSGEYIMFVDGDDWIDNNTVEEAMTFMESNSLDIVFFTYKKEYEEKTVEVHPYNKNIVSKENDILRKRLFGSIGEELRHPEFSDSLCSACMKIYRRSIIEQSKIHFQSTKVIGSYEDGLFNIQVMKYSNKVGYLDEAFYHYRKTNSTSLPSTYKPQLAEQWNKLFELIKKSIVEENLESEYVLRLNNRIVLSLIGIGLNELCSQKSGAEKKEFIRKYITSDIYRHALQQFEFKFLSLKWKVFFGCAKQKWILMVYMLLVIMDKLRRRGIR